LQVGTLKGYVPNSHEVNLLKVKKSSLSTANSHERNNEGRSPTIIDQLFSEPRDINPSLSEVPLLSVKFLNYLARQDGQTEICEGETREALISGYFPKIYELNAREYLVEQVCTTGAYNIIYSYFIYRPYTRMDEVNMRHQTISSYERDEGVYYVLRDNSNQLTELTIPEGEVIPLVFEQYRLNESNNPFSFTTYVVSGRRLYNPQQRILTIFNMARGMADCGSFARYQLEEEGFRLLEYRARECCVTSEECTNSNYTQTYPNEYPQLYPPP
jgi:hypothetical protein